MTSNRPRPSSPPSVWIAHGRGGYANARAALEPVDLSGVRGKRVLLKPNVGRAATPGAGITTDPGVVAAAIDAFREAGADVAVGESPIAGVRVQEAFRTSGIAEVAARRNCPLVDMDRRRFVPVPVPGGRVLRRLKVCPEAWECDVLVSLPVMKTHMHTGVTLAVKNLKGCLWRRSKVQLHMLPPVADGREKPIDLAIADMSSALRPDLAIVDGTVGMEGLGPSAGRPKRLDVVLVSPDAYAADAVACRLMGIDPAGIRHLRIGADRGYGVIDLDRIRVSPAGWQEWVSPFAPPPENLAIEFPDVTVLDKQSCSACQSTLLLFLQRYRTRLVDYFGPGSVARVAIGKGHAAIPDGTLCLGNCAAGPGKTGLFVPGCPPVGSQILAALSGRPAADHENGHPRGQAPDGRA